MALQPFSFDTVFLCLHIFLNIDVEDSTVLCKNIVLNIIGVVSLALYRFEFKKKIAGTFTI